jgi:hypothetical protein
VEGAQVNHLKWRFIATLRRIGWPGQLGFALIVCVLALQFGLNAPMHSTAAKLKSDVAIIGNDIGNTKQSGRREGVRSLDGRLVEFYQYFPSKKERFDLVDSIYAAAVDQAILLEHGEYKLVPLKADKLVAYQINLPVRGTYSQLRKFALQVLKEVPSASLDEISFKREAISNDELEAKIRLTLYMRPE